MVRGGLPGEVCLGGRGIVGLWEWRGGNYGAGRGRREFGAVLSLGGGRWRGGRSRSRSRREGRSRLGSFSTNDWGGRDGPFLDSK